MTDRTISRLCRRMIEDMTVRGLAPATQTGYIRAVRDFRAPINNRRRHYPHSPPTERRPAVSSPEACPTPAERARRRRPATAGVRQPLTGADLGDLGARCPVLSGKRTSQG